MKKSLSKMLARMAKDGDVETVAEFIEELIEPEAAETPAETIAEAVAEIAPVAEAVVAAAEPEAVIETPEATIVVDEATLEGIISRLDQLITLLTPAVTDDDPVEEIVEVVEEVLEAQTAVAEETQPTEDEDLPEGLTTEEIAGIVSGILDPATEATSEVLDPQEDECDPDEQEVLSTGDALRKALRPSRAKLARMSRKERTRVMDRIASCLMVSRRSNVADTKVGRLTAEKRRSEKATELGNRIMATRNANCCKK